MVRHSLRSHVGDVMLYDFDTWADVLTDTIPIGEHDRSLDERLRERLRTATSDEARQLARDIIKGRHDDPHTATVVPSSTHDR